MSKPKFDPNQPFEEVKPKFDPAQPYEPVGEPTAEAAPVQSRFDFTARKPSDVPRSMLKALGVVPDLVKVGLDSALAREPLGTNLDRFFKEDPSYYPGDATAEMLADSPIGQTIAKTGLDIFSDPMTYASGFMKAAAPAEKVIESAASKVPAAKESVLNMLASAATSGKLGPKWAQSAEKFTPLEQITAKTTLDKASGIYAPLKSAADDFMAHGGATEGGEVFGLVQRGKDKAFTEFENAATVFEDAVNKVGRVEGNVPAKLQVLMDRVNKIRERGSSVAPEAAELLDTINKFEWTDFGNPRLVSTIMKTAQNKMRGGLGAITEASNPAYSAARQRVSDALNMAGTTKGGAYNVLKNAPLVAGGTAAAYEAAHGDFKGAAMALGAGLTLRSPGAWNAAAGLSRALPAAADAGLSALSTPTALRGLTMGAAQLPKADISGSINALTQKLAPIESNTVGYMLDKFPGALGKYVEPLQAASAQAGPQGVEQAHKFLLQTDPNYNALLGNMRMELQNNPGARTTLRQSIESDPNLTPSEKASQLSRLNSGNF